MILVRGRLWGPLGATYLRMAFDPGATISLVVPSVLDTLGYNPRNGTSITFTTGVVDEQAGYEIPVRKFAVLREIDLSVDDYQRLVGEV